MGRVWRAIVVDDNAALLRVVVQSLSSIPGIEVVGEATSGQAALEVVDRLGPDLVLMDLSMPGMDGLEATRRLTARPDAPAVIIMSILDLPHYRQAALASGALRFIDKVDFAGQLGPAIEGLTRPGDAGPGDSPRK